MRLALVATVFAALSFASVRARACSCVEPPPPTVAMQRAAAVFEGIPVAAITSEDGLSVTHVLRVLRHWKGSSDPQANVETASNPASCGFPFESGKTYLVYAERMDGRLVVSLCSRTKPIELASDDLTALGPPLATPSGDPVATRPAPEMLETQEPVRPKQEGGCACSGKSRAEFHTATLVPIGLLGLRARRRRPHP